MGIDVRKIQECCLGIMMDIHRVCKEHGISYSLCGGSVIGAYLYHGFIPWDDDGDLMMTRENYDRFMQVYPQYCGPGYHLRHYSTDGPENLPALFARVEDLGTDMVEEIAGSLRRGHVFVDITVFDRTSRGPGGWLLYGWGAWTCSFLYRKNGMIPGTGWKRFLFRLLPAAESKDSLLKRYERFEKLCRWYSQRGKWKYCGELLSAAYSGILYDPGIFRCYTEILFEGHTFMIVRDYKDYLFMRYGKREFSLDLEEKKRQISHIRSFSVVESRDHER